MTFALFFWPLISNRNWALLVLFPFACTKRARLVSFWILICLDAMDANIEAKNNEREAAVRLNIEADDKVENTTSSGMYVL